MAVAGKHVADIELTVVCGGRPRNFSQMCRTMQRLLDELDPTESRG
jgi:hypothetical protein